MSNREAGDAALVAVFGDRHKRRLRSARSVARVRREAGAPPRLWEGPLAWLDEDKADAWEASLSKRERETLEQINDLLDTVGSEMRWHIAGSIMRRELKHARGVYLACRNVRHEGFKAELVRQNGQQFRSAVERLEEALAPLYELLLPLGLAIEDVERALGTVDSLRVVLARVSGSWEDVAYGAERGAGVPGYDSEQGVARARQRAREAHAAWTQDQAAKAKERKRKPRRGRKPRFEVGRDPQTGLV